MSITQTITCKNCGSDNCHSWKAELAELLDKNRKTQISDFINNLLLSKHLNYLEEDVKRLEGELREVTESNNLEFLAYEAEQDKIFADRIFNSAILQEIELKKKEIEEIKKML